MTHVMIQITNETHERLSKPEIVEPTYTEIITKLLDFYEKHHDRIENFPFITNIRKEEK